MTLKVTQGYLKWCSQIGYISLPVSKNVALLHRFRDIATCTLYVTVCDL